MSGKFSPFERKLLSSCQAPLTSVPVGSIEQTNNASYLCNSISALVKLVVQLLLNVL